MCCEEPDLRFLDAFFLAAAAAVTAFSLAILSDATAVGTGTGLASCLGDSQSLRTAGPQSLPVVLLAQETPWELFTSHGLTSSASASEKSPSPTLPAGLVPQSTAC